MILTALISVPVARDDSSADPKQQGKDPQKYSKSKVNQTKEKIVYFFFQEYAPIPRKLSLADCQNECAKVASCQYWSYHQPQQKCFLKNHRNAKTTLDYLSSGYISGIKKCPMPKVPSIQTESHVEISGSKFTFLPSTFGQQFQPGDKVSVQFSEP